MKQEVHAVQQASGEQCNSQRWCCRVALTRVLLSTSSAMQMRIKGMKQSKDALS